MSSKLESMTGRVDTFFPEYDTPSSDPIALGQRWLQEAIDENVREPRAMILSTTNKLKAVSSRVIAILEFVNLGIIFATHSCSRKIKDINDSPFACGHFYWRELGRQLSVSGQISELHRERALEEWYKRPIALHSMSTVSHQSEPLISYETLLKNAQELEGVDLLPCPDRFSIYVLVPNSIEFWAANSNRLHKRLRYEHIETGWRFTRLQP